MRYKRYVKKFDISYSYGTYPCIDMIKYIPENVVEVLIKREGVGTKGVDEVISLCKEKGIAYTVDSKLIDSISVKENTFTLGVFRKYEKKVSENESHIVLVNPSNLGNLGTIIRTMQGFGYSNLVLIGDSADIFDPMVVRSTMGAIFQTNFEHVSSISEYMSMYSNHKLYPFMLDGAKDIKQTTFGPLHSLVFGNEGKGLGVEYKGVGESVYIKHLVGIDSLNLSIAAGIAMYEVFSKKNS